MQEKERLPYKKYSRDRRLYEMLDQTASTSITG
jgi:hypothetical protein